MLEPATFYGPQASILITGASSGIGAALAEHLGAYGGRIALVARREERLAAVAGRVRAAGGVPLPIVCDITDAGAVRDAHQRIEEQQGPITVAFLNAGVGELLFLKRFDATVIKSAFEINVLGVAYWLHELLPRMTARNSGAIAGVSSLAARRALRGNAAYGASKAALSYLLESLRLEAAGSGVQISIVEPGFIRTEMTAKNRFPMPFLLEAEEAARLIADGVAAGQPWIRFPWQLSAAMALLRSVPSSLYEGVTASLRRRQRRRRARRKNAPAS